MRRMNDRINARLPWTVEERAALARLAKEGREVSDIADRLGRSQEAVRRQAHATGLFPVRARRKDSPAVRVRRSADCFLS